MGLVCLGKGGADFCFALLRFISFFILSFLPCLLVCFWGVLFASLFLAECLFLSRTCLYTNKTLVCLIWGDGQNSITDRSCGMGVGGAAGGG